MTVTPPVTPRVVDLDSAAPNRRRGGDLRAMLTPAAVGATSGFMGLALIEAGDRIAEHYHPYSEEFVFVVCGALEVDLDGVTRELHPDQGLMIPAFVRHRFRNVGDTQARMVFHCGPLAPRPELGHVDTEETEGPGQVRGAGLSRGPAGAGGAHDRGGAR
ncbi:cupin domain-containing protein [Streptantibioticus silvisoli]|jgi:putative monooxygenase|uniref:Cupin domain-containing protein n=1 Tax=Streptantibioticus silvisoli TaxID=2705255 RepID=A0ABT6VTE0_9ACTN|nr:cupin domain-containing protein [Streptantibioticus silvisoli]MDI5961732.1 cupin domain-containing protein [Streptantibioticus silvisoli]